MPEAVLFVVRGKPEPGGSKTPGVTNSGRRFVREANPAVKEWRRRVADAATQAMDGRALLAGELRLDVGFYLTRPKGHLGTGRNAGKVKASAPKRPTTKPDTTKLLRALEDALRGIVWADDCQVVSQEATKWYAEPGEPPRAEVLVAEIESNRPDPPGSTP
jgi:Holliday junction resolvase RusA-like endonuclease